MITQEAKSRINKIDYELKEYFQNVHINEKYYKTGYFEISANKIVYLRESRDYKRIEARVIINKPDIICDNIKWSYSTNPINENAVWLDRISTLDTISMDIINIVKQVRLDEEYLLNLETIVDIINENVDQDQFEKELSKSEIDEIKEILEKFFVKVTKIEQRILVNENSFNQPSDKIFSIFYNGDIKTSDMFKLEQVLNGRNGVNWVIFKEGICEISYENSVG